MKSAAIEAINRRAFELRIPVYLLCDAAGVARSTMPRWKKGISPSATTLGKLERALDKLEKEKAS